MKCDSMNRQTWIDCAKAIAIMAVAVDHCNGMLYTNPIIAQASYFSVSLFVLLSGLTAWLSDTYKPLNMKKALRKAGRHPQTWRARRLRKRQGRTVPATVG